MRYVTNALLGVAVLVGLCWQVPAAATTLYSIDINRTSADLDAQTFSGSGFIRFDSPANSVTDIDFFSLQIETIGGEDAGEDRVPVLRRFVFGLPDIVSVMDLVAGPQLSGSIGLAPGKRSEDGESIIGSFGSPTFLDFTDGVVDIFCFGSECIFGGGSSASGRAELSSAIVPLPWALPLLAMALGVLGLVAGRGSARQFGPA